MEDPQEQRVEQHLENNGVLPMEIDGASREPVEVGDWKPIYAERSSNWFYAAAHNITAIVGAGVLALPNALVHLSWGWGSTVLAISLVVTLYTLWQMIEMHESSIPGVRFDRYHELGQAAFGQKLGLYIVVPLQLTVEVGIDIVYMVTAGKSLRHVQWLLSENECPPKHIYLWIIVFAFVALTLALLWLPNFHSMARVSLVAAIMAICYCTIAWGIAVHDPGNRNVTKYPSRCKPTQESKDIFGALNAIGTIAFAYAGHNVVLEIQATLPSTPLKPSKIAMWRGVVVAYLIVLFCYFPVAIVGYKTYGRGQVFVSDDILTFLSKPKALVVAANLMVAIHMIGSYQIFAMPVYDMMETVLVQHFRFDSSLLLRLITRSCYIVFTALMAIILPFFSPLLGFFGGFAFAPGTYFLPCCIWLIIRRPSTFSLSWFLNWICIILGVSLMLLSCVGGLKLIIDDWKTYKVFTSSP